MADDPVVVDQQETFLANQTLFDTLRAAAIGTGTFASNTARDAAIRACCRVVLIFLRNRLGRNDQTD